jgi:hypothetical protein
MRYVIGLFATLGFLVPTEIAHAADWQTNVAQALGKPGQEMPGGVYRIGLPRTDLEVTLDGVKLRPAFALGSWVAFMAHGGETMVMGDLVLTDSEVNPVMSRLEDGGIEITALHNHLMRNAPHTMFMHVEGHGDPAKLAATPRTALAASKTPIEAPKEADNTSSADTTGSTQNATLNTAAIDKALGFKGMLNGTVYAVGIPRAEPPREGGMSLPPAMGSAIAINFEPTGDGLAATTGDFVLTADEVNPVVQALTSHGIEVTAIHNHMLHDEPRLFFMHFWAHDDLNKLTLGLRAALDRVKVAKG